MYLLIPMVVLPSCGVFGKFSLWDFVTLWIGWLEDVNFVS